MVICLNEPRSRGSFLFRVFVSRLPGGTERVINTKSTTVVENIIEELCKVIGVDSANEREEFSLYCIVEGETFTVPLAKEHYILDVTTGNKTQNSAKSHSLPFENGTAFQANYGVVC